MGHLSRCSTFIINFLGEFCIRERVSRLENWREIPLLKVQKMSSEVSLWLGETLIETKSFFALFIMLYFAEEGAFEGSKCNKNKINTKRLVNTSF